MVKNEYSSDDDGPLVYDNDLLRLMLDELSLNDDKIVNGRTIRIPYEIVKKLDEDQYIDLYKNYRRYYLSFNDMLVEGSKFGFEEYEKCRIAFSGYPNEWLRSVSEVCKDVMCENQYTVVSGIIMNDISIKKFHSEDQYTCPSCNVDNKEKRWVRHEYLSKENPRCPYKECTKPLHIIKGEYKISNYVEFYISSLDNVYNMKPDLRNEKLKCFCQGDDLDKLTFGKYVILSGYVRFMSSNNENDTTVTPLFFVTNVESVCDISESLGISENDIKGIEMNRSRTGFISKLISSVFQDHIGNDMMKYVILLQMIPVSYDCELGEKSEINLALFGSPSTGKSIMADYGSLCRLKHRSVSMQTNVTTPGLTCGLAQDPHTGRYVAYPGILPLLDNGGAFVGHEIDKADKSIQKSLYQPLQEGKFVDGKIGNNKIYSCRECFTFTGNTFNEEVLMDVPLVKQVNMPDSILSRIDVPFIIPPFEKNQNKAVITSRLKKDSRRISNEVSQPEDEWDSDRFTITQVQKILAFMSGFNASIPSDVVDEFEKTAKYDYLISVKGLFSGRLSGSLYLLTKKIANFNFRSEATIDDLNEAAGIILGEKGLTVHTVPELLDLLYASDFKDVLSGKRGASEDEFVEHLKGRFNENFVKYLLRTTTEDSIIFRGDNGYYKLNTYLN